MFSTRVVSFLCRNRYKNLMVMRHLGRSVLQAACFYIFRNYTCGGVIQTFQYLTSYCLSQVKEPFTPAQLARVKRYKT